MDPDKSLFMCALLAAAGVLACNPSPDASVPAPPDAAASVEAVSADPQRIVSLIPAVTEILFALGVEDRLVGRTRFGDHPPAALTIPDVGDGMRPALEAVLARTPDLVILYEGEANREAAERLEALGVETLRLRHDTLVDLEQNVIRLGQISGCPQGGRALADWIVEGLEGVARETDGRRRLRVYYEAWSDPPITIGRGSYIDSLVALSGGENVFGDLAGSAPRVSLESIIRRDPDRILVSVAPEAVDLDPELGRRRGWAEVPAVASGQVSVLDQDIVSRLGPRIVDGAWMIAQALHPDLTPPAREAWRPPCKD